MLRQSPVVLAYFVVLPSKGERRSLASPRALRTRRMRRTTCRRRIYSILHAGT